MRMSSGSSRADDQLLRRMPKILLYAEQLCVVSCLPRMSPVPASRRLLVAFFFVMVAALGAWGGNVTLKATTPLAETTASPTPLSLIHI